MDTLETRVGVALTQLWALASALHQPNARWELEVDGVRAQAVLCEHEHGVRFGASFVEVPDRGTMSLLRDGELLLVMPFDRPQDSGSALVWDLSLGEELTAA